VPREADLAARLCLSRSSLREAVKALSLVNILDVQRDASVPGFLGVRRILEPAAAAMAAERVTLEQVRGLHELLDSLGPHPDAAALAANDLEFHRRISAYSGNPALSSLLDVLSGAASRATIWRRLTRAGAAERRLAEHRAILTALASRDPDVARSWATVHIANMEHWLALVPDPGEVAATSCLPARLTANVENRVSGAFSRSCSGADGARTHDRRIMSSPA
jgi:GntR family transcriptional regulator, transcriptional repressor for pyruvate dehydrogenase complex